MVSRRRVGSRLVVRDGPARLGLGPRLGPAYRPGRVSVFRSMGAVLGYVLLLGRIRGCVIGRLLATILAILAVFRLFCE